MSISARTSHGKMSSWTEQYLREARHWATKAHQCEVRYLELEQCGEYEGSGENEFMYHKYDMGHFDSDVDNGGTVVGEGMALVSTVAHCYAKASRAMSLLLSFVPHDEHTTTKIIYESLWDTFEQRRQGYSQRVENDAPMSNDMNDVDVNVYDGTKSLEGSASRSYNGFPLAQEDTPMFDDEQQCATVDGTSVSVRKEGQTRDKGMESQSEERDMYRRSIEQCIIHRETLIGQNISLQGIAGMKTAVRAIREAVFLPIKFPHLFQGTRKPPTAILLYGPPGTGKTLMAKALASECKSTFFSISPSDLMSKWVGHSEKLIRELFTLAHARRPSIIFFDEIDSIATVRSDSESESSRRIKTELLVQMQGINNNNDGILVLAATNLPWQLDSAVRRRFEKRIYAGLPDRDARLQILKLNMSSDIPNIMSEEDYVMMADKTEGFSGSDLHMLCRQGIMEPIRRLERATHFKRTQKGSGWIVCLPSDEGAIKMNLADMNPSSLHPPDVTVEDMLCALGHSKVSIATDDLLRYDKFTNDFGMRD